MQEESVNFSGAISIEKWKKNEKQFKIPFEKSNETIQEEIK